MTILLVPKNRYCTKRTQLSPYFADTKHKLFKTVSMKPDINPIENSVDPDQLASKEAS